MRIENIGTAPSAFPPSEPNVASLTASTAKALTGAKVALSQIYANPSLAADPSQGAKVADAVMAIYTVVQQGANL